MCEPITLTTLAIGGAGAQAFGAYQQSQSAKAQAKYQANVAEANAQIAQNNADLASKRGFQQANLAQRQAERLRGTQAASLASNGLDITTGSALSTLEDTVYMGQQDAQTIKNNAAQEAWGYKQQSLNETASASMYKSAAKAQKPGMSAGLSLLGSAGQFAGGAAGSSLMRSRAAQSTGGQG